MAAKAAATAKPKAAKPVTSRQLAAAISEQHQLTKKQGLEVMDDLVGMITKHLKKGERVKIAGLGILQVRKRAARMGRNPATAAAFRMASPVHSRRGFFVCVALSPAHPALRRCRFACPWVEQGFRRDR